MANEEESFDGLVPGRDVIMSELEPLDELLQLIPKKAISGLISYQQHVTSVTAKDSFIFIGTNLGVIYVLEKFYGVLAKIHAENRKHEITCLAMQNSHDYLACGSNKGTLVVFKLRISRDNVTELVKKSIESSHVANIKCMIWSPNGKRLFTGDASGKVSVTLIDFEQRQLRSSVLIHEDSGICQLDFLNNYLVVSSKMKCFICNCDPKSKEIVIQQVGSKPRKSPADVGACLWTNDDQISIYACRPGLRLWKADVQGKVQTTMIFKDAIIKGMYPPIAMLGCFSLPTSTDYEENLQFGLVRKFNNQYLCIWYSHYLWIIDPLKQVIVGGSIDVGNIIDVALTDTDIYLLRIGNEKPLLKLSLASSVSVVPRSPPPVEEHTILPPATSNIPEDKDSGITEEHVPIGKKIASIFTHHKSKEQSTEGFANSTTVVVPPLSKHMDTHLYPQNISQTLPQDNVEEEVVIHHSTRKKKKKHIKRKPTETTDNEEHGDNNKADTDEVAGKELNENQKDFTIKETVLPVDNSALSITEELNNISKNLQIMETSVSDILKEEEYSLNDTTKQLGDIMDVNMPTDDDELNPIDIKESESKLSNLAQPDGSNFSNTNNVTSREEIYKRDTDSHLSIDVVSQMVDNNDNYCITAEVNPLSCDKNASTTEVMKTHSDKELQSKVCNKDHDEDLATIKKESTEDNNLSENNAIANTYDITDSRSSPEAEAPERNITLDADDCSNVILSTATINTDTSVKEDKSDESVKQQPDIISAGSPREDKENTTIARPKESPQSEHNIASSSVPSIADTWSEYPGPGGNYLEQTFAPMNYITSSNSLIWCCDKSERIYYMPTDAANRTWHRIDGNAIQIATSVSGDTIWCVTSRGKVGYRTGIVRPGVPIGKAWSFLTDDIDSITQLDLSDGCAWAATRKHLCLVRLGISDFQPGGVLWNRVPTKTGVVMVACNNNIVWAIDRNGYIMVRLNVTPDVLVGDSWAKLSNLKVTYISLKDFKRRLAWVIDCHGDIYYRKGVTAENPFGENKWYQISFGTYQVNQEASIINTIISTFAKKNEAKAVVCTPGSGLCVLSYNNNMYIAHGNLTGTFWGPSNLVGVAKSTPFKLVSASSYGDDAGLIWVVQQSDEVFTIDGQNRLSNIKAPISIKEICSSAEGVWAISKDGKLLVRKNITKHYRQGDEWNIVDLFQLGNVPMVSVSCGIFSVWAVDINGCIWYRTGVADLQASISTTPAWIPVDSQLPHSCHFVQIYTSPGDWMVWTCDNKNNIYVRTGIRPEFPIGESWEQVQGASAVALTISNRFIWAICPDGSLICRYGITPNNIAGDYWKKVPGNVSRVSATPLDELWGIDKDGILIRREIDILRHSLDNEIDVDESDWVCL
ncbi:Tectonin beta-propeller repeat-containing protein 2 [Trichoplax sp. H2]|nr:Tectonin beta-propeller repeat-containing protein 2 [Trichoplax sp. H2]|eukprot:RDD44357.1 Tectonin beta-propeller repeat-containing protein 2 [Trichoplax sp. H2]